MLTCWRKDSALFQMSTLIDTCWGRLYLTAPWNRELTIRIESFPHCLCSDLQITGNLRRVTNPFFSLPRRILSLPHSVSLYFCLSLCNKTLSVSCPSCSIVSLFCVPMKHIASLPFLGFKTSDSLIKLNLVLFVGFYLCLTLTLIYLLVCFVCY